MPSNPYQSPQTGPGDHRPGQQTQVHVNSGRDPFSLQAAKFSLFAPFLMIIINICATSDFEPGEPAIGVMIVGLICGLTIVAAFVFGVIGLVGGAMRRALGTIVMSLAGLAVNGLLIWSTISVFIMLSRRA